MSEKTNSKNNKWQKFTLVFVLGFLGVMFIVVGNLFDDKKDTADLMTDEVSFPNDADAYAAMLEERVKEICSQISGVGTVDVFVSLKGGYRTVYAVDSQSTASGYKNEVVMSGSGSDKRAVITSYENPEIAGVGIVCSGNCSDSMRASLISLVSAALDVGTNKIFVVSASP